MDKSTDDLTIFPLLPLRDVVVFPYMVMPLFVGREESILALEVAMEQEKKLFLVGQKDPEVEAPTEEDLYQVGTIATILQMLQLPDGTVKLLVEGYCRASMSRFIVDDDYLSAHVEPMEETGDEEHPDISLQVRTLLSQFEKLVQLGKNIPQEVYSSIAAIPKVSRLADGIAAHLNIKLETRQQLLEQNDLAERLHLLTDLVAEELDMLDVEKRVQGRVRKQVEKSQRQYYLGEKIKAIQKEMGDLDESGMPIDELEQLEEKIQKSGMTEEALEKSLSELSKLKMMSPMSAEATVSRNYIDTMLQVPWKKRSKVSHNLLKAKDILDADHYGLKEVKERILEYLAVQQRVKKLKGPIVCLVGPPGVGKTSLGQSIANATGRKFIRVSLGGVRDEAEIRGHRRTYIGAMPGKVIQKLSKVKVKNPLFMLDEVDKMAADFRGDPASALLEVLDPEQNNSFNDHYLEVDYDLSDVMFIATANSLDIPVPLLDRMELIRLSGYTEHEKLNIAKRYLLPRQLKNCGLKPSELKMSDGSIREIIRTYTRESGVRNLDREIAKIARKVVRELVSKKQQAKQKTSKVKDKVKAKIKQSTAITLRNLEKYLGVKRFRFGSAEDEDRVGQVTGLAWTEVGGELLTIEAQMVPGKGKSQYTGHLGNVMQESIHAALTVVRSRAASFGIEDEYFQDHDWHVHVPEGATPKDGPSAGVGMCTALVSAITTIPVRSNVAMTGEITLRGEVLPIGGLKEKLLAALRGEISDVIIPKDNERDLKDIPNEVLQGVTIHPVRWIDEVFHIALASIPVPLKEDNKTSVASKAKSKSAGKPSVDDGRTSTH